MIQNKLLQRTLTSRCIQNCPRPQFHDSPLTSTSGIKQNQVTPNLHHCSRNRKQLLRHQIFVRHLHQSANFRDPRALNPYEFWLSKVDRRKKGNHLGGPLNSNMAKGKNKEDRPGPKLGKRRPETRDTLVSKKLSFLLRHGAEAANVKLHRGGWVSVSDVLAWGQLRQLSATFEELIQVTTTNEKKRYQIAPAKLVLKDGENAETAEQPPVTELVTLDEDAPDDEKIHLIRATQGHSIKSVEAADLLTPIALSDIPERVPEIAVHGTDEKSWPLIQKSGGLKPMSRTHVHLASSVPGGPQPVISGMRKGASVLVWVNVKNSLEGGVKWWLSANGVILSEGVDGMVPIEYFDRVERRERSGATETIWRPGEEAQTSATSDEAQ